MTPGTVPQNSRIHTGMGSNVISMIWFLPFLSPIVIIILLFVFGPCILNFLVKFVSSSLESIKLKVLIKITMIYYHVPLSWSALMPRAPLSPLFSKEQLPNRRLARGESLFFFPRNTCLYQRDNSPSQETTVHTENSSVWQ
jgi:hypothetical protein